MPPFAKPLALIALGCTALAGTAQAQVVREDDASSIAGTLTTVDDPADEYTFRSKGGEILFADVDATIYEMVPGTDHHEPEPLVDEDGESCEGGPGIVCLEVLDAAGNLLCSADRPTRPGWQRDAALICPLDAAGDYTLRVTLCSGGEHEEESFLPAELPEDGVAPYLLNVSLRGEAPEGNINPAIAQSRNALP